MVVMEAVDKGYGQLLVESLRMKDTFGSNMLMEFSDYYDVPFWNSFYPKLPRLVLSDPLLNPTFDPQTRQPYKIQSCSQTNFMKKYRCIRQLQHTNGIVLEDLPGDVQSKLMNLTNNKTDTLPLNNSPTYFGIQGKIF
jgi:hypothetical protein